MHVEAINARIAQWPSGFTRQVRTSTTRGLLIRLHQDYGAASISHRLLKTPAPRPRNVTASDHERFALLAAAPPHLRCWILLCSDLAIRSGTAAQISPANYDSHSHTLTFTTKKGARQTLPVTAALATLLDTPGLMPGVPYVAQLGRQGKQRANVLRASFRRLRESVGITRKLTCHDLRRTTATKVYDLTHDLRAVQALLGHADLSSTLWYLDHHARQVPIATLELAKLNPTTEVIQ